MIIENVSKMCEFHSVVAVENRKYERNSEIATEQHLRVVGI